MPKRVVKKGSFTVDLYKVDVEIIILYTSKDVSSKARELSRKFGCTTDDIAPLACGYALTFSANPGVFYILLSLDSLDVNTVTHESDHLREYIMEHAGVGGTEGSATLSGYLNEKIFRFLHKNNLQVKVD